MIMSAQLRQNCTHVLVGVGLGGRRLMPLLDLKCPLEVNKSGAKLVYLTVVARQVIVGHGQAMVVIFSKLFAFAEELKCIWVLTLSHVLDCEHVTDVADLNTNLSELSKSEIIH